MGAAETGSTKESEEASFGHDEDGLLSSKDNFLYDKIVDFQLQRPETFKEITAMLSDEASINRHKDMALVRLENLALVRLENLVRPSLITRRAACPRRLRY